jgi:hypothetical protein
MMRTKWSGTLHKGLHQPRPRQNAANRLFGRNKILALALMVWRARAVT